MSPRPSVPIATEVHVPTKPSLSRVGVVALVQAVSAQCATVRSAVRVLSITLDQAAAPRPTIQRMSAGMAMAESAPPPIQPGDVTVYANVTVVYEIAERNDAD